MEFFRPIEFSTYIHRARSDVYQSLITMEGWNGCFTTGASIDLKSRTIHFRWHELGPDKINAETLGKELSFQENRELGFTWHHESLPAPTKVSFELTDEGEGTVLSVKDEGYPKTEKGEFMFMDCSAGWAEFLTLLKIYLETGYRYRNW